MLFRVATVVGPSVPTVLRQPASLTLWTYWQLLDAERIERLMARDDRFDAAGLTAVASWDGKMFEREKAAFRRVLQRHPDPSVEARANADAVREGHALIQRVEGFIGGQK